LAFGLHFSRGGEELGVAGGVGEVLVGVCEFFEGRGAAGEGAVAVPADEAFSGLRLSRL
jgi:hypothetical protein